MRALFDVNVLIALFDPAHVNHSAAHAWIEANSDSGWASCPLTENGCVRIMTQPKYPNAVTVSDAMRRLGNAIADTDHAFWPDSISLTDAGVFAMAAVLGPRQLTDVYLLALAVKHEGRLVSFDRTIPRDAVVGAESRHLVVL